MVLIAGGELRMEGQLCGLTRRFYPGVLLLFKEGWALMLFGQNLTEFCKLVRAFNVLIIVQSRLFLDGRLVPLEVFHA